MTQLVECPVYAMALGERRRRWILAFAASAFTHPIIFFIFPSFWPDDYWRYVAMSEAFAILVEAGWLTVLKVKYSIAWAVLANGASVAVGWVLRTNFGWP